MFALIDCNNFYASCECVFNPQFIGKPLVVLSNNDGCVIARSKEAKALGIPMGIPVFKIKDVILRHNVVTCSSNFSLYGDLSHRVMETLKQFSPNMQIYSIDEAFLDLEPAYANREYAIQIQKTVLKWTGIMISIGFAATKTLAKAANLVAKKNVKWKGIYFLEGEVQVEQLLKELPVEEIWGIGSKTKILLNRFGIYTAWEFRQTEDLWIRKKLGVVGLRTAWELRGISCLGSEEISPDKKSIICSRSFVTPVREFDELSEILASFIARAVEKARHQESVVSFFKVYIATSPHRDEPYYSNYAQIVLPQPTAYTPELITYAKDALKKIFKPGLLYKKAGVMLGGLVPEQGFQQNLFAMPVKDQKKREVIMKLMDKMNKDFGKKVLRLAAEGIGQSAVTRDKKHLKRFTTRWDDLLTIYLPKA